MPDAVTFMKGLSEADRQLFGRIRADLRGSYIEGMADTVGAVAWSMVDDAVLDSLDLRVIELFERRTASTRANTEGVSAVESALNQMGRTLPKTEAPKPGA